MKSNTNNSKPQTTHSASPTILVTGGAGYIGSITVKALIDSGSKVIVVDNLENGYAEAVPKQAKLEIGDVGDREFLDQVFKKYSITAVIDFAAYLIVGESMNEPRKYLINNVLNFINLLDVMLENNCNLIIKSSTASVYGNPSSKEDFPLKESYIENFKPATSALLSGFWHDEELSGDSLYDRIISEYYEKTGCRPEFELDDSDLSKLKIPTSIYGLTKLLRRLRYVGNK
ncbi:MAG: NAD-dependent epimerase/dehydratase family protein, partial [Candidatus Berkelbacteria bacterium]|nr:NAD-dependent epimerase/dehydratase family protein [Candidatus Berkelbacteria bacterium]